MQRPIVVLSPLIFLAMYIVSCTPNPAVLTPDANDVRVGKDDPSANATELGPVTGTDGTGCGIYGYRGTYERAYIQLKNNAAARGANYVQLYSMSQPHLSGNCFINAFTIAGMAYKLGSTQASSRSSSISAGTCFAVA